MKRPGLLALFFCLALCLIAGVVVSEKHDRSSTSRRVNRPPLEANVANQLAAATDSAGLPEPSRPAAASDALERMHLLSERDRLEQLNAKLTKEGREAAARNKSARLAQEAMIGLTGALLDPKLKVPQTVAEAGALMGKNIADGARFTARWGKDSPADDTPEAAEYEKEHDALLTDTASLLKFMRDETLNANFTSDPVSLAQFQAQSLVGSIGLREDQVPEIDAALNGFYQQGFTQGLNQGARPESGVDEWEVQRHQLSQQAFADIVRRLTPDEAAAFRGLYDNGGTWLWSFSLGGLD